jgi:hypothetical protein
MRPVTKACSLLLALLLFAPAPAAADSWPEPTRRTYESADGGARFTVWPRAGDVGDRCNDPEWANWYTGAELPVACSARGLLEHRTRNGRWIRGWERYLRHTRAPGRVVVANDGTSVVTLDDWGIMGRDYDVVVIYDDHGQVVRKLKLEDILTPNHIDALPRSMFSRFWRDREVSISKDAKLLLQVALPNRSRDPDQSNYAAVAIDLATGEVALPTTEAWQNGQAIAAALAAEKAAAEEAARVAFIAPLVGPSTSARRNWYRYLREAFFRVDPAWQSVTPSFRIFGSDDSDRWTLFERQLGSALRDPKRNPVMMIAAPGSPQRLTDTLATWSQSLPSGALEGVRIYVAIERGYEASVQESFAKSGATVILLDPSSPIPQRSGRQFDPDQFLNPLG